MTLRLNVEKVSLEDSSGDDTLEAQGTKVETSHRIFNYSPPNGEPDGMYFISLERKVLPADIMKQKLSKMPGFRVSWLYTGVEVEPEAQYYYEVQCRAFIRNVPFI